MKLPWTYKNVSDCRERTAHGVILDADDKIICDTINGDCVEVSVESDDERVYYTDMGAYENLRFAVHAANHHNELINRCKMLLEIMKLQLPPKLGEWNWPDLARDLETLITKADYHA